MTYQTYLVGGAVRDRLMGIQPKDTDYVVVGGSPEIMLEQGFEQVGADFPVFLHPQTGDEYALARAERKTGVGYHGFTIEWQGVSLEQDLSRRDLTCNAIAQDAAGNIIDPFGGQNDITSGILRHVSDAFADDPVRVLRVARFAARYGWQIAPETMTLMQHMVASGELTNLTGERVLLELQKALVSAHPRIFFDVLLEVGALEVVFPEVDALVSALENPEHHPEGNAYEHTMLVLTQAAVFSNDFNVRFAALVHDFGKGITPTELLPAHHGHDKNGVSIVEAFCERLRVARKTRQVAIAATRWHMAMHRLDEMRPAKIISMLRDINALKVREMAEVLYLVGCADTRGRLGAHDANVDALERILHIRDAVASVRFADVFPQGERNPQRIQSMMLEAQIRAVKEV